MKEKNNIEKSETVRKTRYIISLVIVFVGLIGLVASTSYAILKGNAQSVNEQVIKSGSVELTLTENYESLSTKIVVMEDENGLLQDNLYDFNIKNTGNGSAKYKLKLVNEAPSTYTGNVLSDEYIKVGLEINGKEYGPMNLSDVSNVIDNNTINEGEIILYKLRIWLDSSKQEELSNMEDYTAFLKIEVEAEQSVEKGALVTPEKCFSLTPDGMVIDYYCGDTTQGSEKYYNLVIPKEFSYGYTYLNQTDWNNIKNFLIDNGQTESAATAEINEIITSMAEGNYNRFSLAIADYVAHGGVLTTEKQQFGIYTTLNNEDKENITTFAVQNMGMSEEEVASQLEAGIEAAEDGDYSILHYATTLYLNYGGKLTTKKGVFEKVKTVSIYPNYYKGVFQEEGLKSVVLPEGIKVIGDLAFLNNNITKVDFPNSVTYIGEGAFSDNKITNVLIPNSVETIMIGAFAANDLRTVQLGTSTESKLTDITNAFGKVGTSNPNFTKIINKTGKAFDFYSAVQTAAPTGVNGTFETGTIVLSNGNIEVVTE